MHKVIINGETQYANDGTLLSDVLIKSGKGIDHPCGGMGTCKKCIVTVNGKEELSCQYIIKSDMSVLLPESGEIISETGANETGKITDNLCYALDIGTTTLALALVSLDENKIIKVITRTNPQRAFGAAGVSFSTLAAAETGVNISFQSAEKLSRFYSAPLLRLFEAADPEKTLSKRTILSHHRLLSELFHTAVRWGVLSANPAQRVDPPRPERKEAKYLDEEQARQFLRLIQQNAPTQYRVMIVTLLFTGMRIGELCGLEWKDIDFQKELIHVRRSSQYLPGKGIYTKEPKNASSVRVNKFSHSLFVELKAYKAWQSAERMRLGDQWVNCDRLFTQWNGTPIYPNSLGQWLNDFIKTTDLPAISVHSLRHTNASLLISGGTDLRTVASRLGHSQTSTTMNIYAHAIRSKDEMAAETMEIALTLDDQQKAN